MSGLYSFKLDELEKYLNKIFELQVNVHEKIFAFKWYLDYNRFYTDCFWRFAGEFFENFCRPSQPYRLKHYEFILSKR